MSRQPTFTTTHHFASADHSTAHQGDYIDDDYHQESNDITDEDIQQCIRPCA